MKHLAKLELMLLPRQLQSTAYEDEHTSCGARRLAINRADVVLALLEWKTGQLPYNALHTLYLLSLEGEHRSILVKTHQIRSVCVKYVIIMIHESL